MCDHEELLDSGEYVCIKCGVVLAQEYIHEENSNRYQCVEYRDPDLYSRICTILEHLNLSTSCYVEEISSLIYKYLSNFRCKHELKIGASIYYLLSSKGIPCQLNRVSGLVCSNAKEIKKIYKLIQIFPQDDISINNITSLAQLLLDYTNFDRTEKQGILQFVNILDCKFCSYSPITQIAGISYWYFKEIIHRKKSLKTICTSFLISQNSVHLYLNHNCAKHWTA